MKQDVTAKTSIHLLILAAAAVAIYSNTFQVPFLWDDLTSITENPVIKNLENFFLNARGYEFNPRRFVGYLTLAFNYSIGGLDVTGYHVVNLAIHIINSLLLYALILLTFRTPAVRTSALSPHAGLLALCAALLFVVHPIQTQAVTYIVQRLTSLTALFYLLSLCLYAQWRLAREEHPAQGRKGLPLYIFSLITIVLAMKTKEIAFTLPVMVVLYEFCFFRQRKLISLVPVLLTLAIIPFSLINIAKPVGVVLSDVSEITKVQAQISRWDYLLTQFTVITTYIRLLFLPVNQNLDYDYPVYESFWAVPVLLSFLFLLALVVLGVYLFVRSGWRQGEGRGGSRLAAFGVFWFFIALSVESSVIPIIDPIFEHRVYLPSAGFFIAFATGLAVMVQKVNSGAAAKGIAAVVITAVVVLGGATYARNGVWQSETALWEDVVEKSPLKARPHNNLGSFYDKQGRSEEAVREILTAIQLKPDNDYAYYNLGIAYTGLGRIDDAIEAYRTAIRINPRSARAYNNLGILYGRQRQMDDAVQAFLKAIEINPDYVEGHHNLGVTYRVQGRLDEAAGEFRTVLSLNPDHAGARKNLESLLRMMK